MTDTAPRAAVGAPGLPQYGGYVELTADELVAAVKERGYPFTLDVLRSWEYIGLLPRVKRRRFKGATRRVYSDRHLDLIACIYLAKDAGIKLNAIQDAVSQTKKTYVDYAAAMDRLKARMIGRIDATTEAMRRLCADDRG